MKYSKPTQRLVGDTYLTSRRDKAVVDGRYSSIIMAKSLTGDKDVLTVEPGIENSSNKMQKMRMKVRNNMSETITGWSTEP